MICGYAILGANDIYLGCLMKTLEVVINDLILVVC